MAAHLESVRVPVEHPRTSEEVVLGSVGHDLCEKFFRGYTRKQWGLDLSELAAGVAARIPTRSNDDDRYFTDTHQAMPAAGYTEMFRRMLDHPLIRVELGVDYLAHSKLRPAAFGPELLVGPLPAHVEGRSRILRGGEAIFDKPFLSGEDNMSHTIANLEHHHFKYAPFRRPGDLHVHMFGTATLSFADGIQPRDGDVFEISSPQFGLALKNPLHTAPDIGFAAVKTL